MRVFVTGASGYIGNRMAEILLEKDWVTGVVGTDITKATCLCQNSHGNR